MPEINFSRNTRNKTFYHPFPPLGDQFSKSFFPHFTKQYNNLDSKLQIEYDLSIFKENLKIKMKPKKYKHFGWGSKRGNALHTQLRVGRSFLNAHGFAINLVDSDLCLCSRPESVSHFLNGCFLYTEERRLLYSSMEQLVPKFGNLSDKMKTDILLHGINIDSEEFDSRNSKIIYLVQDYIFKTKRF